MTIDRLSLAAILSLDAVTCIGMGLILALASGPIAGLTAIPAPLLFGAGLSLLPLGAFMALCARPRPVPARGVLLIVLGNVLWVLLSVLLPLSGLIVPNGLGWAFLLLQAAAVAVFASLEWTARPQAALGA